MPDRALVIMELRGAASLRNAMRVLAVGAAIPFVSLWPHSGSPFASAFAASFLALEPLYNNALQLWPGQITAYALLPTPWEVILRAKLISSTLVSFGVAAGLIAFVSFFQPIPPTSGAIGGCALYLLSVHFPLFATGMLLSRQQPRATNGFGLDDAAAGAIMMVLVGLWSIPYLVLSALPGPTLVLLAYAVLSALAVWLFLIPSSARRIHNEIPALCHSMRISSL